ncbi:MAG: NUDIX hydrolase [Candidatus Marsarchaeota archaeon]|nr:NUDIX hydrolase [Candidatus Marsarchaeota archaeon]MCL5418582.1 NUDIX hydrolase [Candidatus Marsarchaeota archaeon]
MDRKHEIVVKAMLICTHNGKVLLQKGSDVKSGSNFYRLIGGHVEFLEKSDAALKRELMEELHTRIVNLKLLSVMENMFELKGEKGHEIVFIYSGTLTNNELYRHDVLGRDEDGRKLKAYWVPFSALKKERSRVYPKGVYSMISKHI